MQWVRLLFALLDPMGSRFPPQRGFSERNRRAILLACLWRSMYSKWIHVPSSECRQENLRRDTIHVDLSTSECCNKPRWFARDQTAQLHYMCLPLGYSHRVVRWLKVWTRSSIDGQPCLVEHASTETVRYSLLREYCNRSLTSEWINAAFCWETDKVITLALPSRWCSGYSVDVSYTLRATAQL